MSIKTDSTPVDEPKTTEDNPLYHLIKVFAPEEDKDWVHRAFNEGGTGYGDIKKRLFEYFLETFREPRARFDELVKDPAQVVPISVARALAAAGNTKTGLIDPSSPKKGIGVGLAAQTSNSARPPPKDPVKPTALMILLYNMELMGLSE